MRMPHTALQAEREKHLFQSFRTGKLTPAEPNPNRRRTNSASRELRGKFFWQKLVGLEQAGRCPHNRKEVGGPLSCEIIGDLSGQGAPTFHEKTPPPHIRPPTTAPKTNPPAPPAWLLKKP